MRQMERHLLYRTLQTLLTETTGRLADGVEFNCTAFGGESAMGVVLDLIIEQYFDEHGREIKLPVRQLAETVHVRPDQFVRALVALGAIELASNHIKERMIQIDEASISETGTLVVRIRLGGWLTYQLESVCQPEVELSISQ